MTNPFLSAIIDLPGQELHPMLSHDLQSPVLVKSNIAHASARKSEQQYYLRTLTSKTVASIKPAPALLKVQVPEVAITISSSLPRDRVVVAEILEAGDEGCSNMSRSSRSRCKIQIAQIWGPKENSDLGFKRWMTNSEATYFSVRQQFPSHLAIYKSRSWFWLLTTNEVLR